MKYPITRFVSHAVALGELSRYVSNLHFDLVWLAAIAEPMLLVRRVLHQQFTLLANERDRSYAAFESFQDLVAEHEAAITAQMAPRLASQGDQSG